MYNYVVYMGCSMGRTSGLLVKVLACNQKVAGSSPTRYRLFFPYEYTQMYPQNEMFITTSFRGDVKLPVPGSWLILATYSSFLVKPHLVKPLVEIMYVQSDTASRSNIYFIVQNTKDPIIFNLPYMETSYQNKITHVSTTIKR